MGPGPALEEIPMQKKMIFVNLPVENVAKSSAFYEKLGAKRDLRFCDESSAMMSFSESIHLMLLSHYRFRNFTPKAIANARKTSEVLLCLSEESRAHLADSADTLEQAMSAKLQRSGA